jgi:hypothetical protein
MSGIEGAGLVIGIIGSIITIIDSTTKVYEAAHDAKGLPSAFNSVAERFPIVKLTLDNALAYALSSSKFTREAMYATIETLQATGRNLAINL